MDPTPPEMVQSAIDELLYVVAKSSEDLHAFHDRLAQIRGAASPPDPRVTLILIGRIVRNLRFVEDDLRDALAALGHDGADVSGRRPPPI